MFIKDLFYSFQGEGPWVGYPQLFLRFYGCNIHCDYCDEPDYSEDKKKYTLDQLVSQLKQFEHYDVHSLSLTGGEPLMYADAIKEIAPLVPYPLYLETNATLPDKLNEIKDLVTYFSIDYKPGYEEPFEKCLSILKGKDNVFVKYILCPNFPDQDITSLASIVKPYNVPFVIQPVTPFAEVTQKASPDDILRGFSLAKQKLNDVRVIPQTHKFLDLK